jgi:hypothetical protein
VQHSIIKIEVLRDISNLLAAKKADINSIKPRERGTMIKITQKEEPVLTGEVSISVEFEVRLDESV